MRVLVCGGRDFTDVHMLDDALDFLHATRGPITDIIHGGSRGADMLAHEWANRNNIRMWPYLADWKTLGRSAGPIRNQRMIDDGRPDMVVAFPGGKGTADMIKRAEVAGIHVRIVD